MDLVLSRYLERMNRRRREPSTIKNAEVVYNRFDKHLASLGKLAVHLTAVEAEDYFDDLLGSMKLSTVSLHRTYIQAAYLMAIRRGEIRESPLVDLELPQAPDIEPVTFSTEQLRAIYQEIETEREQVSFYLLAYAGLRKAEARLLPWSGVDLRSQTLTVDGKARKIRKVPIHPALGEVLMYHRSRHLEDTYVLQTGRGTPLSATEMQGLYRNSSKKGLLDRAGIEKGTIHSFRKTVATNLDEAGVRESVIDDLMGWSARTVRARHYTRVAPERLHEGILHLYATDPITR